MEFMIHQCFKVANFSQFTPSPLIVQANVQFANCFLLLLASDESHYNPKRRAVSPSHIGIPSTLSSPVTNSPPSMAGSSGSAPSTPSHNIFMKEWLYKNF